MNPRTRRIEYSWQWAYQERFKEKGLTAILGCGFDPGVTAIFTAYAAKHHFDEIHYLDIVDCNAGNHGMAFATNFNPEINIREVTSKKAVTTRTASGVVTEPHEIHKPLHYPEIGERESYVIYHEELESLVKNYPDDQASPLLDDFRQGVPDPPARDSEYRHGPYRSDHLQRCGDRADSVPEGRAARSQVAGCELSRPDFDRLPHPGYQGRQGAYVLYLQQLRSREGVPGDRYAGRELYYGRSGGAGASMWAKGLWRGAGVFNVEEFDPDPLLAELGPQDCPGSRNSTSIWKSDRVSIIV